MKRFCKIEKLESRELFAVTYHGGALIDHVEAQAVFIGSNWNDDTVLAQQKNQIDSFVRDIVQSPYMDLLENAGYRVGRGSSSTGVILSWDASNSANILKDADIQKQLQNGVLTGQLEQPDSQRLYVVYVEPGVLVQMQDSSSANAFLGYHGAFQGSGKDGRTVDFHYAVIAYPGPPNPNSNSQGFAADFDQLTSVASHEMAEALTDPDANYKTLGWYDDQYNGEIGDITRQTYKMDGYTVQAFVDLSDRPVLPTPTPKSGFGLVATAMSSTTAHVSWNPISGAILYRIVNIDARGRAYQVGMVDALTTSVDIKGLRAGSTATFQIQAVGLGRSVKSELVSVTRPAPVPLLPPVLSVSINPDRTANLSWTGDPNVKGYRNYQWYHGRPILLGSVGGDVQSVVVQRIFGKNPQWLVQAFSDDSVASSNWA